MSTPADDIKSKNKPPGLFSSNPTALLALLAVGTGAIALASLGVEVMTERWLAKTLEMGISFVSAPLGAATVLLAALTARMNVLWSAPAFVMGAIYWLIFVLAG